mgnify:CR=1 FL=1
MKAEEGSQSKEPSSPVTVWSAGSWFSQVIFWPTCAVMVVGAKGLSYILKRKDTYYD